MNRMRNKTKEKGFTLLELLVALALMDVIAMALFSSLYIATKAKESTTQAITPYRRVIPAFEFLRKDLNCAVRPSELTNGLSGPFEGYSNTGMEGYDSDELFFYSSSYQPQQEEISSNIIQIGYTLERDEERNDIVLVRKTIKNILSSRTIEPEGEIICRHIRSLDLKFYDGYSWQEEWDSTLVDNRLPLAVQVTIYPALTEKEALEQEKYENTMLYEPREEKYYQDVILITCADRDPNQVIQ